MTNTQMVSFVNCQIRINVPSSAFNWELFPTIAFEMTTDKLISPGVYSTFTLVLGPKQYISTLNLTKVQDDLGFWQMGIRAGKDTYATLGLPVFSAYYIEVDRDLGSIGFSLGCGCNIANDGYPQIKMGAASFNSNMNGPGWEVIGAGNVNSAGTEIPSIF